VDDVAETALNLHKAFLDRKYESSLTPLDPAFDTLPKIIPTLALYYTIIRNRLSGFKDE
jgi:hypothetical protein